MWLIDYQPDPRARQLHRMEISPQLS